MKSMPNLLHHHHLLLLAVVFGTILHLLVVSSSFPVVSAQEREGTQQQPTSEGGKGNGGQSCSSSSSNDDGGDETDGDGTCLKYSSPTSSNNNIVSNSKGNTNIECNVYMAPSTVGNYSNLGIYTAASMKKGEIVPYGEIVIPLLWRIFGIHPKIAFTDGELWDRYIWEQHVGKIEALHDLDRSSERASVFIPGVGCTVNSMLHLSNIKSASGSQYDDVVDRSSPGAGAFSPYHSSVTTVTDDDGVKPGQELFASYGIGWIPWIPNVAVTLDENFVQADDLMDEFEEWIVQHEEQRKENSNSKDDGASSSSYSSEVTDELLEAMWKFMVNFPYPAKPLSVLPKEWSRERLQRKKTLLASMSDSDQSTASTTRVESTSREYWAERGKVSIDFLKEHGRCQDHIRPDISTLPHAGRGAFATRDLPEGTVVGYAPLIHVAIRGDDIFQVTYENLPSRGTTTTTKDNATNHNKNVTRPDLVLNYSFGHKNSTLVLTPYGAMINYINHQSTKDNIRGGGGGANVRIQWPTHEMVAHKPNWLTKDIYFLRDTIDKIGLSFEYVALRDIKEGEEVFMDYGDGWSKAWEDHVANWVPPHDADGYVHSTKFSVDYLRTPDELEIHPYPWNLHTLCVDSFSKDMPTDRYVYRVSGAKKVDRVHCRVLERHDVTQQLYHQPRLGSIDSNLKLPKRYLYTVELTIPADKDGSEGEKNFVVHDVPRNDGDGINLYDKAHSQSWHLEHAFRHKMYIPDDIMPESWMNLIE